ncbi:MAG: DNA gyrase inhibitor YacG [Desulfobacterota bacterium]|nr:DNA gyrase inhibitor YacG [Thermodesulfobacteriota bacterium]
MVNRKQPKKNGRTVECPACGKEVPFEGNPCRPFCSRGCKGLDLVCWATEGYRIEGKTTEDRAEDESD